VPRQPPGGKKPSFARGFITGEPDDMAAPGITVGDLFVRRYPRWRCAKEAAGDGAESELVLGLASAGIAIQPPRM
jgi:hypothetical protein